MEFTAVKLHEFLSAPTGGVTRASAPVEEGDVIPTDPGVILDIALDLGAETLRVGGEVNRVEDTVTRVCRAYGAVAVEAFAITSLITAEIRMPDGSYATRNRRVLTTYNHLARLEAVNALSRTICAHPISAEEVRERLKAIHDYRPVPEWLCYIGGMLATGGFTIFFGGTLLDGCAAAVIAFFLTLFARLRPIRINGMVKSLISSFAAGALSVLCVTVGFGDHVDKLIIGTLMLEIPGLSFGNALRDLLCGDTLAGTMRIIQALLQTLMIALGYMAALVLFNQQIGG
jgi:uncharacterized membrane protein YjjP (DUF1212 family)